MATQRRLWATYNEGSHGPRGLGKEKTGRLGAGTLSPARALTRSSGHRRVSSGLDGSCPGQGPGLDPGWGLTGGGGPERVLTLKGFSSMVCPNGPRRRKGSRSRSGVGPGPAPNGAALRASRGSSICSPPPPRPWSLYLRPTPPPRVRAEVADSPPTLARSYSRPCLVASGRDRGPSRGEWGRWGARLGGHTRPGLSRRWPEPTQALPQPLASPERARPQRCKLFFVY